MLDQPLKQENGDQIVSDLLWLADDDPLTDIVLLINSPGGSVEAGYAIIDVMQYVTCDVVTYVTGVAGGMGHVILAAGAKGKRYALPHSRVEMHRPPGAGRVEMRGIRSVRNQVAWITSEQTGRTVKEVVADLDANRSFSAGEARVYGLVDEVVRQRRPLTRMPPDLFRDTDGNTHLHRAYLSGDESFIHELLALGADPGLHNASGLTPPQMAEVRLARSQLLELAALINPRHSWGAIVLGPPGTRLPDRTWTDPASAARLCALLRGHDPRVYALALNKAMTAGQARPLLKSAIRIGRPESLTQLEALLNQFGTLEILNDYLNCGSRDLVDIGREWAYARCVVITEFPGGGQGGWGTG